MWLSICGVLLKLLLTLLPRFAIPETACNVVFRNIGGVLEGTTPSSLDVYWVPATQPRQVHVRSNKDWDALVSAVQFKTLRLEYSLSLGFVGSSAVVAGSKLIALDHAARFEPNSDRVRSRLRRPPPSSYPVQALFRSDAFITSVNQSHSHAVSTFVGHVFEVEAHGIQPLFCKIRRDGEVVVAAQDGRVASLPTGAVMRAPDFNHVSWSGVVQGVQTACKKPFAQHPQEADYFCGPMYNYRFHVTSRYDHQEEFLQRQLADSRARRLVEFDRQKRQLHHFTDIGFTVLEGPRTVLNELRKFYFQERLHSARPELIDIFNPTLTPYESDTWSMKLKDETDKMVDSALRPLVASWAGLDVDDLTTPIIHGPRLYHNGSQLHMHVDNFQTHAFGIILHLGHLGLSDSGLPEPWPLVMFNHAGQKHVLPPDSKDHIVLYEAATCPHYREGYFHGREFANLFVHYAPKGWPETYLRSVEL